MTLVYSHRVRYHEADAQGFLFNSRYLELADVSMTEYFRSLGWPYKDLVAGGTDPSVVSAQITFLKPCRFEDLVDVDVNCTRVGRSSFNLTMKMSLTGEDVAHLEMTYVNVDAEAAKSRAIPDDVARALKAEVESLNKVLA